jgi:hypothetical protein
MRGRATDFSQSSAAIAAALELVPQPVDVRPPARGSAIVPSRGFHRIKRMMLGSVAEQLIRHFDCAVLVLHRRHLD